MKRYGFIGYGNMGRAVVLSLLRDRSLVPDHVTVFNRTSDRLVELSETYPDLAIAACPSDVARASDVLFLCTDTSAVQGVMDEISSDLDMNTHLVTINGGVSIDEIEALYSGPVSKVIPTMIMSSGHGFTLIAHSSRVPLLMQEELQALFERSSKVKVLTESCLNDSTGLTSCAPGLMAMIVETFAQSGARSSGLSLEEVKEMVIETLLGTAITLATGTESIRGLMEKVATRGGMTEKGLEVLEMELPATFDRMFEATMTALDGRSE